MNDLATVGANAVGKVAGGISDAVFKDAGITDEKTKEMYQHLAQQIVANNPELAGKFNDPRILMIIHASVIDGYARGQEKLLEQVLPEIFEKVNVKNIDLQEKDWQAKIEAESELAKKTYDLWLKRNETQLGIDADKARQTMEVNTVGTKAYQSSGGRWAALMGAITAVVEAFQTGSLQPIKNYIAEFQNTGDHSVKTTGISARQDEQGNAYHQQRDNGKYMVGAKTAEELAREVQSSDPTNATKIFAPSPSKPEQGSQTEAHGTTSPKTRRDVSFAANASTATGDSTNTMARNGQELTGAAAQQPTESEAPATTTRRKISFADPTPNAAMGG